jgi:hypothetical protein
MFAGQAARLAEHCGRITAKEASKREAVSRQLERHLPLELLAKAGLLQEPPHCTVRMREVLLWWGTGQKHQMYLHDGVASGGRTAARTAILHGKQQDALFLL